MIGAGLGDLPGPVGVGILLGLLGSLCVAALFALAHRHFPSRRPGGSGPGESRRRSEFRDYLRAIDEPFAEDHPVAGQSVAFYLPARDVAITFDARAYYRILGTEVEPVLVEHEMPGTVLGARLPFETPRVSAETAHAATTGPLAWAFEELGVAPDASAREVTRAYRQQVKETHPDQGGDEAAFRRLREAYATAKRQAASD